MSDDAELERELIKRTRPFEQESRARSLLAVAVTVAMAALAVVAMQRARALPLRLAAAVFMGVVLVRLLVLYHDARHGSLLRGSWLAARLFDLVGVLLLTPPSAWTRAHNHHHANNGRDLESFVGAFPIMTLARWRSADEAQRRRYLRLRSPWVIAGGYLTIFFGGFCLRAFLRNRANVSSAVAVVLHLGLVAAVAARWGWATTALDVLLPMAIAGAMGAYFFYAQHNFPGLSLRRPDDWTYASAALEATSYMAMGPLLRFLTANIGYHHVHHVNPRIPFYRLPEAMSAIPELQAVPVTTLHPVEVVRCLRLHVWDEERRRMLTAREVAARAG